jgi:hypothetical protein
VVVELWPGGDETRREVLGQAAIANITPDESRASYLAAVLGSDGELDRVATVVGHDRRDGWANLVSRALAAEAVDDSEDAVLAGTTVARHLLDGLARLTSGDDRD